MSKDLAHHQHSNHPLWLHLAAFFSSKAPKTQDTYRGILLEWLKFIGGSFGTTAGAKKLISVSYLHAVGFQEWLKKQPGARPRMSVSSSKEISSEKAKIHKKSGLESSQSNATIWKKCAALRRMYRVIISAQLGITENPFDSERAPPPAKDSGRKRPTEMINFEDVQKVLDATDLKTEVGRRDFAILSLLFGAGLRRSEVSNLRLGDVKKAHSGTTYLYLRATKSKRDAEQPLPQWAADALQDVFKDRILHKAVSGDYLFVTYEGRSRAKRSDTPISHTGIWRLFKSYCLKADVFGFKSPHSARATAITKLLTDGIPHRFVQAFSRHASVQMVELYDKRRLNLEDNPGIKISFK